VASAIAVAEGTPARFVGAETAVSEGCRAATKQVFDYQSALREVPLGGLESLNLAPEFESEYVWEELQLRNRPLVKFLQKEAQRLDEHLEQEKEAENGQSSEYSGEEDEYRSLDGLAGEANGGENGEESGGDSSEGSFANGLAPDEELSESADEEDVVGNGVDDGSSPGGVEVDGEDEDAATRGKVREELEDEFLKLDEMESFLEKSEQLDAAGRIFPDEADEEAVQDDDSDAEEDKAQPKSQKESSSYKYDEFFLSEGQKKRVEKQKRLFDAEDDVDEAEETTLEKRQKRLRKQIDRLEDEALQEKDWAMKGEVFSNQRPMNSLMDATFEHDIAAKPVPVITEENTEELEDVIRRRIIDGVFDDVVRKAPPLEMKKRNVEVLSQEKSNKGLAEIYEEEYLAATKGAQKAKQGENATATAVSRGEGEEEEEERDPRHVEVDALFKKLCRKLDVLSSMHYTPKVKLPGDIQPRQNVSAITMEDAAPDAGTDATALAPQEVYAKPKPVRGETEMTKEERRAKRGANKARAKVRKQRKLTQQRAIDAADPLVKARREEKLAAAAAAKARQKNRGKRSSLTKSKDFFSNLQQSARDHVKKRDDPSIRGGQGQNAAKLKL